MRHEPMPTDSEITTFETLPRYRVAGFGAMVEDDHGPWIKFDDLTAWLANLRAKLVAQLEGK